MPGAAMGQEACPMDYFFPEDYSLSVPLGVERK